MTLKTDQKIRASYQDAPREGRGQQDRVGISVECATCKRTKKPIGRAEPLGTIYCTPHECDDYYNDPKPGSLWPGEKQSEFGYLISDDGTVAAPASSGAGTQEPTPTRAAVVEQLETLVKAAQAVAENVARRDDEFRCTADNGCREMHYPHCEWVALDNALDGAVAALDLLRALPKEQP